MVKVRAYLPNLVSLGLGAAGLLGCAANPATGVRASGEPLGLKIKTEAFSYTQQEKVGTVEYRTATGAPDGSADIYKKRTVHGVDLQWRPTQGTTIIDDQDFFRIAGDEEAERQTREQRDYARLINRVGYGLVIGGVGVMGFAGQMMPDASSKTRATVGGLGLLGTITGALFVYYGIFHNRSENHVMELERARLASDRYNETLKPAANP
jgi:hypothetical protein